MQERQALACFAALAQETRLRILRLLIVAGPNGLAAGSIAEQAGVSASNSSFHLKELERAGLVAYRRESRSVFYTIDFESLNGLLRFLTEDCCAGQAGPPPSGTLCPTVTEAPAQDTVSGSD